MIETQKEWIASLRDVSLLPGSPVKQKNGVWEIASRKETWEAIGPRLFDEHIERFKAIAVEVLRERDPKFELEKDQRYAANVYGKILGRSQSLRRGLCETLALLSCSSDSLTSCTRGKPEIVAELAVSEILKNADWILWGSLNNNLPTLAEAAPLPFLKAVENALSQEPCPFAEIYSQEDSGVTGQNYLTGLLWALETLAWNSDYLQRVTVLLGDLAAIDPGGNWANRPSKSLTEIFLPWFPQTCAPILKRKAAVTALLKEQPAVGWKLIISLLPSAHNSSMGCRKPSWRKFIPPGWSDKVTKGEYWEQVKNYAEMLVDIAIKDVSKVAELVSQLSHLPEPAHSRTLDHLTSKQVVELPENLRSPIWESLTALTARHRRFSTAPWVMPPDAITKIEDVTAKLAPKSLSLLYHRLFSERDYNLCERLEDYDKQEKKIWESRQVAVQQILDHQQMDGLLDFAKSVTFPELVGQALGGIKPNPVDKNLLPKLLDSENKTLSDFIGGFVWGRFAANGWNWVDSIAFADWTPSQISAFFAFLPFIQGAWQRAESFLGNGKAEYWSKANVRCPVSNDELLEAGEKLLDHDRPGAALWLLYSLIIRNKSILFPPTMALRALIGCLNTKEKFGCYDGHTISEVIRWLQNNPDTNHDELFKVEWAYLRILDHGDGEGVQPKVIEGRLASDPGFFCEVIEVVFRPENAAETELKPKEKDQEIAENAYRLLRRWRTVPGTDSKGTFHDELFKKWLSEVVRKTKASGYHRIALDQIGKVLSYTPKDPDGLWIHHVAAEALNAKEADDMRAGFACECFNRRGVYGFSAGKEELQLAAGFNIRADALEERGYQRIATTVRGIAKSYERDSERDVKSNPRD